MVMTDPQRNKPNSRTRILDAAAEIVAEIGAGKMSLEAVAERAGLSKGGLLYNFPTKESLLQAMIERLIEESHTARAAIRPTLVGRPNPEARSIVAADLALCETRMKEVGCGLLAAVSSDPHLLAPVKKVMAAEIAQMRADDCPEIALIAWLAMKGLFSLDVFAVNPFSQEEQAALAAAIDRLLDLRALPEPDRNA